jgi:hypothetical protein
MNTRTDEVRGRGRERGGSGGGAPFVRWGDRYAWIEGRMTGSFDTKYGLAATIKVSQVGGAALEVQGKDEEGAEYSHRLEVGTEVNVGTQAATLAGKILAEDKGKAFHIAFEGWEEPKGKNRYRMFTVIELTDREPAKAATPSAWDGPEPADTHDYSQDEDRSPLL